MDEEAFTAYAKRLAGLGDNHDRPSLLEVVSDVGDAQSRHAKYFSRFSRHVMLRFQKFDNIVKQVRKMDEHVKEYTDKRVVPSI